jgi:hypothetical protein
MSVLLRATPLLLTAGVLAACGNITGGVGSSGPSANQRYELANSIQDEVESALPAMTASAPATPAAFPVIAGCPAVSGTTDSDGDGIPNDATLSFLNPPCTAPGFRGGTLGLTGTLRIQDGAVGPTGGFSLTLTNLAWTFTDSGATRTFTSIRNGTRTRSGDSNGASVVTALTTVRQRPTRANATLTVATTTSFTANVAGSVQSGQPLPSGQISIAGSLDWKRSSEHWTLAVSTPVPLQYDASCTGTPQRIKAGILTLTGTVADVPGVLTVTWSACGTEPAREWIPAP